MPVTTETTSDYSGSLSPTSSEEEEEEEKEEQVKITYDLFDLFLSINIS